MLSPLAIQELQLTRRTIPEPKITSVPQVEETHKPAPVVTKPVKHPWYNDGIHTLTDTTWFRWLMVFVVAHYIYTTWFK